MRIAWTQVMAIVVSACSNDPAVVSPNQKLRCPTPTNSSPMLGETYPVRFRETATMPNEGLQLVFQNVAEDTRCPVSVQCIWEGNGKVDVKVSKAPSAAELLSLNTNETFQTETAFQSYRIELLDLVPYPEPKRDIGEETIASSFV